MHVPVDEQPVIVGKVRWINPIHAACCCRKRGGYLRMRRNTGNPTDVIEILAIRLMWLKGLRENSWKIYEVKPSPATKSSIDGLERVRLDSSEASGECYLYEAVWGWCWSHSLALLTFYHRDCIVQWLETSRLCPLCCYSIPHWIFSFSFCPENGKFSLLSIWSIAMENRLAANILQYTDLEQVYCR